MKNTEEMDGDRRRAVTAQAGAAHAFARLLLLCEKAEGGQARHVARFVASVYNGDAFPFDLFLLRMVDVAISDDMLVCLDALRWGLADLYRLVPGGDGRVQQVIKKWGMEWPQES